MAIRPKAEIIGHINRLMDAIPSGCDKSFDLNNDNFIDQNDLSIAQGMTESVAFEVMKEYEVCKGTKYMYLSIIAIVAVIIVVILVARAVFK